MNTSISITGNTAITVSVDGMDNIMQEVAYRICASNGTRYAYHSGTAIFGMPDPDSFVAYEDLTEKQVREWIASTISDDVYTALEAELAKPVPQSTLLPWESKLDSNYQ